MKYFFTMVWMFLMLLTAKAEPADGINNRLLETFKRVYPEAKNIVWVEEPADYIVHFNISGIRHMMFFDKDGNLIESTRYYGKENLSLKIVWMLKRKYSDAEIYGVTEVSDNTETVYFIKLETATQWKTVQSDQTGNLTLTESLNK
jgi:hypothetical protein